MEEFGIIGADNLFVNAFDQQMRLESMSNQALNQGIDHYMKKEYDKAAQAFEKSINLAPSSSFTADATLHLARTYLKDKKTDKAVEAYQRGIELNRDRDDLNASLGNLFFAEERYDEALEQYKEAVRKNPISSNHYSLGQGYIKLEKFSDAEHEFRSVIRMEPESPHGYFGLGQTFSQQNQYKDAIENFNKTLDKQRDYYDAYAEIGYALADMGEIDDAEELVDYLENKDKYLSDSLDGYINKVEPPKIMFAWGTSTFRYRMTMNTPVSALDSYLETANASKSFTMKFQFNKEMDRKSVENPLNWNISRSESGNLAKTYKFGEPITDKEIELGPIPDYVLWDKETMVATLSFTITQNDTADGTLDPSHIVFKYNGADSEGIRIDPKHDEYTGFSGVA